MTTCPFCGLDPYEYVDVGIGSIAVAVNCCGAGSDMLVNGVDFETLAIPWMANARATIERLENALLKILRQNLSADEMRQIADEAVNGPAIEASDDDDDQDGDVPF